MDLYPSKYCDVNTLNLKRLRIYLLRQMKAALKAKCSLVPLDPTSLGFRINTKQLVRTELLIVVVHQRWFI